MSFEAVYTDGLVVMIVVVSLIFFVSLLAAAIYYRWICQLCTVLGRRARQEEYAQPQDPHTSSTSTRVARIPQRVAPPAPVPSDHKVGAGSANAEEELVARGLPVGRGGSAAPRVTETVIDMPGGSASAPPGSSSDGSPPSDRTEHVTVAPAGTASGARVTSGRNAASVATVTATKTRDTGKRTKAKKKKKHNEYSARSGASRKERSDHVTRSSDRSSKPSSSPPQSPLVIQTLQGVLPVKQISGNMFSLSDSDGDPDPADKATGDVSAVAPTQHSTPPVWMSENVSASPPQAQPHYSPAPGARALGARSFKRHLFTNFD